MKATELRLDNLILEAGEVSKIYLLEHRYKSVYQINDITVDERTMSDRFQPIPLTEDWLIKFGFVFNGKLDGWELAGWMPFHIEKRTTNYMWWFVTTFKKDWQVGKLQYVHQLQNLYFALTDKELQLIHPPQ